MNVDTLARLTIDVIWFVYVAWMLVDRSWELDARSKARRNSPASTYGQRQSSLRF